MRKSKIRSIIGLLILMWMSITGQYLSIPELYDMAWWLGLIDISIITAIMMIIPLICKLINRDRLEFKKGKRICIWNSIGMFCLSAGLTAVSDTGQFVGIGGVGALIFYFINKWTFVYDESAIQNTKKVKEQKDKVSVNVVEEQEESIKIETKIIKYCKLCGGKLDTNNKCKKCGKQYFTLKGKILQIITFALLIVSVGINILLYIDWKDKDEMYCNSNFENSEYEEKAEFLDENIVFVIDENSGYYYTYDCVEKLTAGREFEYWAFNIDYANSLGYSKGYCN